MYPIFKHYTRILSGLLLTASMVGTAGETVGASIPPFIEDEVSQEWLVLGMLPNEAPALDVSSQRSERAGLDHDYLEELGGEAEAVIRLDTKIHFTDTAGTHAAHTRRATVKSDHGLNLRAFYREEGITDYKVAYAFRKIHSPIDQELHALFGSDDHAMVWINGERAHRFDAEDRGVDPDSDHFRVKLRAGDNRILVKVENGSGGWGFALRLVTPAHYEALRQQTAGQPFQRRALAANVVPIGDWAPYLIRLGPFPGLRWEAPEVVERFHGPLETTVRWFDAELNEVTVAEKPGRYAAYLEGKTGTGGVVRRALTVYAVPADFQPWLANLNVPLPEVPDSGVDSAIWREQADDLAEAGGKAYVHLLLDRPEGARLLAGLHERSVEAKQNNTEAPPAWLTTAVRDQEYHLRLKAKVLGLPHPTPPELPKFKGAAPVLHAPAGDLPAAHRAFADQVDTLCRAWAEESGVPFTLLVAHDGVILVNGAYGARQGSKIDVETPFDIASISKLITGALLTVFLDQGLIHLDDPVGKYLPDFPLEGTGAITIRQCMMHLAGTREHSIYQGLSNPWLENHVAHQPDLGAGTRFFYNGLSLNVVARCMEMVSGKSFPRLLHEHLYGPLDMNHTRSFDAGYGTRSTAYDLALIGQMLMNRGRYGERVFFSPESAEMMYPVSVGDFYPKSETPDVVYGLGTTWVDPESRILTHGSATRSVLRIGLDNGMLVTMARPAGGPAYDTHFNQILAAIAELEPALE